MDYDLERLGKRWTGGLQFLPMQHRELSQELFAIRGQFDQHFAAILLAVPAHDGAPFHQAVNELDCAVMPQQETRGKRGDGGTSALRQAFYSEQ